MHRWRYVDPQAQTQGPFPARTMLEWYRRGLLNDMSLQTCGAVSCSASRARLLHGTRPILGAKIRSLFASCCVLGVLVAQTAWRPAALIVTESHQCKFNGIAPNLGSAEHVSKHSNDCSCRRGRWLPQTSRSRSTTGPWES